jgi:hypothetical protein
MVAVAMVAVVAVAVAAMTVCCWPHYGNALTTMVVVDRGRAVTRRRKRR